MRLLYIFGEEMTGRRAREIHTLNRVCSLTEAGVEVTLVFAANNHDLSLEEFFKSSGKNVPPLLKLQKFSREWNFGGVKIKSSGHFQRQVAVWLQKQPSFDVAYLIHLKAASFLTTKFRKLPVVFESHEVFSDAYSSRSWKYRKLCHLEESVYRGVTAVVSTSKYLLGELSKNFALPAKQLISPNCAESIFFTWETSKADPQRLLYLGSFQSWKGVPNALLAMKSLPEYTLTVIGGSDREVQEMRWGAPENVRFLGYRTHDEIREEVEKSSIALIPNRVTPANSLQTFPMKLVEYAAAGKKIVATDLPILKELQPGSWCSRVPADQPEAIARAVREQSARTVDPEVIRDWARAYQWDLQAVRIKEFIEQEVLKR